MDFTNVVKKKIEAKKERNSAINREVQKIQMQIRGCQQQLQELEIEAIGNTASIKTLSDLLSFEKAEKKARKKVTGT